jgi:hypothetical protein
MGTFISKVLANDVNYLETLISQFTCALHTGQWDQLMSNQQFWTLVQTIRQKPKTLKELQGYVISL